MAMEEIIVRLGVDSSGFVRVLDQTNEKLDAAGGFVDKLGAKLATVISVAALTNLAKQAIQYASDMNDAAEATRTGVEEYQVLAQAARESGASLQQLDQALIKSTLSGEKAAAGNKELSEAFAALNIDVAEFNALPTERKLEALGAAYNAAGASTEAYTALTEILGTKAAPRLVAALQALGDEGFDAVRAKAEEAGVVLNRFDAIKLDALSDQFATWKTKSLVFIGEVISSFDRLFRFVGGSSAEQIYFEDFDPARAAARIDAINQLIEQDFAAHQQRMASLGSQRNPYYDEAAAKAKIVADINADEERIQARIIEILAEKQARDASIAESRTRQAEATARQLALDESNQDTLNAVKMVEEGRALLRLKELSDKERLIALEQQHAQAVEVFNNMLLLGEGTDKEKEAIAKRVLDLEKQIADTKAKADADTIKTAEERAKMQGDLLKLIEQEAALMVQMNSRMYDEYGQSTEELAAADGGSSLSAMADAALRARDSAQRNFTLAANSRLNADRLTGASRESALRAADEADERAALADARFRELDNQIKAAQGGQTGDPVVDKLEDVRKEMEELNDKLDKA